MTYQEKVNKLHDIMERFTGRDTAVAFSGGVDSSLILKLALQHSEAAGTRVYAFTAKTELHPMEDLEVSRSTAAQMGAEHLVVHVDELACAGIEDNPKDRCYRCKKLIFTKLLEEAKKLGVSTVLEGTNLDDTKVYRPGLKALEELKICSPLKEAEFTKQDVRRLAAQLGISTASRPSAPCMATRFPYGTRLTVEKLGQVEQGEIFLKGLGYQNLRLRVHENVARIEVLPEEFERLLADRQEIIRGLKALGYDYITLDLAGFRSGSMDEVLHLQQ